MSPLPSDLSALFGTLVGRIGDGNFFSIGTSFDGTAANAGVLSLFAWDSNSEDNSGDIRVTVTTPDGPARLATPDAGRARLGRFYKTQVCVTQAKRLTATCLF